MAQLVNRLRNNIFVNPPPLPLLCEISGALHLAQPGLTAGRQADEMQVNFENFKVGCRSKHSTCRFVYLEVHDVIKYTRKHRATKCYRRLRNNCSCLQALVNNELRWQSSCLITNNAPKNSKSYLSKAIISKFTM